MQAKKTDLIILATARARPGMEGELESALRECAGPTRAQPGCVEFRLLRAAADRATLIGYERWASEVDHDRHLEGPHIQRLMERMGSALVAPPVIVAYAAIDE